MIKSIIILFSLLSTLLGLGCTTLNTHDAALTNTGQPNTGQLKSNWVQNSQEGSSSLNISGSLLSVALSGDNLIYANAINSVNAYHKKTGKILWSKSIKGGASGLSTDENSAYYMSMDGQMTSVNSLTGKKNWSANLKGPSAPHSTTDDKAVYLLSLNDQLYALNKLDGSIMWTYTHRAADNFINMEGGTKPLVDGQTIYFGTSDGYLVALNKSNGDMKWKSHLNKNKKLNDLDADPIISGNKLYINSYDDKLYCINKTNGKEIWSIAGGGGHGASLSDNKIYFSNTSGEVFSANKDSGKEIVKLYQTKKGITTKPLLVNNSLLFSESNGSVVSLNLSDLSTSKFSTGLGVVADLVSDNGSDFYAASKSSKIYSLATENQDNKKHSAEW